LSDRCALGHGLFLSLRARKFKDYHLLRRAIALAVRGP
jgi:hypothetical protein